MKCLNVKSFDDLLLLIAIIKIFYFLKTMFNWQPHEIQFPKTYIKKN